MATGDLVSYLRISTARQGQSGLVLEAQRQAVADFLNGGQWRLVKEFVEVESGKVNDRAELAKAMALCGLRNAVLVIARSIGFRVTRISFWDCKKRASASSPPTCRKRTRWSSASRLWWRTLSER